MPSSVSQRWAVASGAAIVAVLAAAAVSVGVCTVSEEGGAPGAPAATTETTTSAESVGSSSDTGDAASRARARADAPAPSAPSGPRRDVHVDVTARPDATPVAGALAVIDFGPSGPASATTDASGKVTFSRVPHGSMQLVVRAAGFRVARRTVPASEEAESRVAVRMERGATIDVLVLDDATAAPMAEAVVWFRPLVERADSDELQTGADGHARGPVTPDAPYVVSAWQTGYLESGSLVRSGPLGGPAVRHEIRLLRAATLRAFVVTPDGKPWDSALVHVWRESAEDSTVSRAVEHGGRTEFEGLRPGRRYLVCATGDGHSRSDDVPFLVPPGTFEHEVRLALRPRTKVVVRPVDDEGNEVSSFDTEVLSGSGRSRAWGIDGEYRTDVAAGPCRVRVSAVGFVPAVVERVVEPGETWTAALRLSSGTSIRGIVVDDRGAPVAGAQVSTTVPAPLPPLAAPGVIDLDGDDEESDLDDPAELSATTGDDGRFELERVPEGVHELRASEGILLAETVVRDVPAPSEGVRIVLVRRGRLRLRLAFDGPLAEDRTNTIVVDGKNREGRAMAVHVTGPAGAPFDVAWPHDAGPDIVVSSPGFAPRVLRAVVPRAGVLDLGEVRLVPGVAVEGTVRDAQGRNVVGAVVVSSQATGAGRHVLSNTDERGVYRLEGLAPGHASIEVRPMDRPASKFDVEVGSGKPQDLVLPAPGVLRVVVFADDGGPADGVALDLFGADGRPVPGSRWFTDEDGAVRALVPPGRVTVEIAGRVRASADVRAGDAAEVRIDLPR